MAQGLHNPNRGLLGLGLAWELHNLMRQDGNERLELIVLVQEVITLVVLVQELSWRDLIREQDQMAGAKQDQMGGL